MYVYDEKEHDTLFVQHAFRLHQQFLTSIGCQPRQHVVWNDGCASQFKSAKAWYFLKRYHKLTVSEQLPFGCQIIWSYFTTEHGKGKVDGASALLKRELHKEQLKPQGLKIQNAKEVVTFLQLESNKFHAAHPNVNRIVNKIFWEVNVGDVDRSSPFHWSTIIGSRKTH